MTKKWYFHLILLIIGIINASYGKDDHILKAYYIGNSDTLFTQKSINPSSFWSNWGADRDSAYLTPVENGWNISLEPFSNQDDAQMIVKAAYSKKGIFFHFRVIDNKFNDMDSCHGTMCNKANLLWNTDAIDFFIDTLSSTTMQSTDFVNNNFNRLTKSQTQYQVRFGNTVPVTFYRYLIYSPSAEAPHFQFAETLSITKAYDSLGIIFKTYKVSSTVQIQEWFLPWSKIGDKGINPDSVENRKFGLILGYNDADENNGEWDALRWKNASDPYRRVPPDSAQACKTVNGVKSCNWNFVPSDCWGDLLIVPQGGIAVINNKKPFLVKKSTNVNNFYYLNGKRALPHQIRNYRGIILEQDNISGKRNTIRTLISN